MAATPWSWIRFNPWKGFEAIWTVRSVFLSKCPPSFNPWKGFEAIWTVEGLVSFNNISSFNPWKGFEAIWTESIHTDSPLFVQFQSLKGFRGNLNQPHILSIESQMQYFVSIPERVSRQFEHGRKVCLLTSFLPRFNPWKGFEAIWTLESPIDFAPFNVSIPERVSRQFELSVDWLDLLSGRGFNPWKGFEAIWTKLATTICQQVDCFNPWKGFEAIWTGCPARGRRSMGGFNPWKGFEAIWTINSSEVDKMQVKAFQSLKGFRGNLNGKPHWRAGGAGV